MIDKSHAPSRARPITRARRTRAKDKGAADNDGQTGGLTCVRVARSLIGGPGDARPRGGQSATLSGAFGHAHPPAEFVLHAGAQRVRGVGLAVDDEGLRRRGLEAAQPLISSSASAWPEAFGRLTSALRRRNRRRSHLSRAPSTSLAPRACDLEPWENDVVPACGAIVISGVQYAPAGQPCRWPR